MANANSNSNAAPTFADQLTFGTSASLGLPDLAGGASGVMGFAAPAPVVDGFLIKPGFAGTEPLKSYSLAIDLFVDDAYKSKWFALLQTEPTNTTDADFLINANSGLGISGNYTGAFTWDAWHRIILTVKDLGNGNVTLSKYLDGALVGTQSIAAARFQIDPQAGFRIFSDDGASQVSALETQPGFVSSVMFTDQVLTTAQVTALGGASAGGILNAPLAAGQSVQFDFNPASPLAATFGTGAVEVVSSPTDVLTETGFGTTAELGIPTLSGGNGSDEVMAYLGASAAQGYHVQPGIAASAADGKIHDYTMIWDVYAPASNGRWMALLQTDPTNVNDADFLLRNSNGLGISGNYAGTFNYTGWNRIAVTIHDNGNGTVTMNKYLNGTLVGTQSPNTNVEANAAARYAIDPDKGFLIFSDNGGAEVSQATPETAPGYVNSVFFTDKVMTTAEISALGGAKSGGIMQPNQVDPDHAVQFDFTGGSLDASIGDGKMSLWDKSTGVVTGDAQGIDDSGFTATQDTPLTIDADDLLANDVNPHGYDLTIQSVTAGIGGTVALDANGDVIFTPTAGFSGGASFSYTVSDGHGVTDQANVSLTVESRPLDPDVQKGRHVVFVGIDGTQLTKLMALGQAAADINNFDMVEAYAGGELGTATQQGTVSGPGWSTLLTGVWANEHGITGNSNSPIKPEVVSLFERIKADIPDATTASVVSWPDINNGHFALETGATGSPAIVDWHAVATGGSMSAKDADTIRQGVDLITNEAPTFTFLHLDNVDAVGHSVGFGAAYDQAMLEAARQVNAVMVAVAERMAANPDEDWMVVLGTDHGRDAAGLNHGGQTAGERQIFIAANKELSANGVVPQTSMAATIAEFLGLSHDGIRGPSVLDENAVDSHAPYLLATTPGDDLQNVAVDAPLKLILSERVEKGTGAITIHLGSDGSVVETIDVGSDRVNIAAGIVTVHPSHQLAAGTDYYVTVDAGAFDDLETRGTSTDGNAFAGINDVTSWSFRTAADTVAPVIVDTTPDDDATAVVPDASLTITFDEAVRKGTGSVVIHRADGSVVETIDVASSAVSIDGKTVTVDPSATLAAGNYYVTVSTGAFQDMADHAKVLFSENFEGLTPSLQSYTSSSEIRDADLTDWTPNGPDGWTHVNNTPSGGPQEFRGWTFHDRLAWTATEGDQGRSGFTKGQGVVAVADPDAYDDLNAASTPNKFSALLKTPDIDVTGLKNSVATLTFDNSWANPTSNTNIQEARVVVTFDNGETREIAHWSDQAGSPYFKATATNETLNFAIDLPEGATTMSVSFDMIQAGNAYWWAIDNVAVTGNSVEPNGNAFAGITDPTAWNFSVEDDATQPTTGNDMLVGTAGADEIHALSGNDVVQGLGGDDKLYGDEGSDTLIGGEGNDTLDGGEGDDLLAGEIGNDHLIGGAGADVLDGGEGDDTLEGGAGSDIYNYRSGDGADTIIETAVTGDIDTLFFDDAAQADVTVRRHGQNIELTVAGNTIVLQGQLAGSGSGIEMVAFADGASLTGAELAAAAVNRGPVAVADTGSVTEAEAKVFDLIANDTDEDLDTLTLSAFDVASVNGIELTNEQAKAAFSIDADGKLAFNPGEMFKSLEDGDTATVTLSYKVSDGHGGETTGTFTLTVDGEGRNLEVVNGTAGSDVLTASENGSEINAGAGNDYAFGAGAGDVIHGEAGNDYLFGNGGDDVIDGGAGHDTLFGGDGNDILIGGAGNDRLVGGAGSDTFVFATGFGSDTVMDFADGDVIDVSEAGFADYAALQAHVTDTALGATLTLADGSTLTIANTTKAMLAADDFHLAA